MTEDLDKFRCQHSANARSDGRPRFGLRVLFVAILAIGMLLALGRYFVRRAEESHARSCLTTVEELADRTISESIPQQNYGNAIAAAMYIKGYYPAGTVLAHDHPFAKEYEAERQRHIGRIRSAIESAVGDGNPSVWEKWRETIEGP